MAVSAVVFLALFAFIYVCEADSQTSTTIDPTTQQSDGQATTNRPGHYGSVILPQSFGKVEIVDAVVETAPSLCSSLSIHCGFQVYNRYTFEPSEPFIKYCDCPEDEECRYYKQNLSQNFYGYKCYKIPTTEAATESIGRRAVPNLNEDETVGSHTTVDPPTIDRFGLLYQSEL